MAQHSQKHWRDEDATAYAAEVHTRARNNNNNTNEHYQELGDDEAMSKNSLGQTTENHELEEIKDGFSLQSCLNVDPEESTASLVIWNCLIVVFLMVFMGSSSLCVASTLCFLRSWTDEHHWWPTQGTETHFLDKETCPLWLFETHTDFRTWTSRRLLLGAIVLVAAYVTVFALRVLTGRVRARLRERRLEVKYPWLSRLVDRETSSSRKDNTATAPSATATTSSGSGSSSRAPSVSRRHAAANFSAGFASSMAKVHDSTLSVGLSFKDLCVDVTGKRLLHKVNGTVRAGRVTALMGPSGAGK